MGHVKAKKPNEKAANKPAGASGANEKPSNASGSGGNEKPANASSAAKNEEMFKNAPQ